MNVQIQISPGELIDRISILSLKVEHAVGPARAVFARELDPLLKQQAQLPHSPEIEGITKELADVNRQLWKIEDNLRLLENTHDFGERFIELARSVYQHNDRRSALRRQLNLLLGGDGSNDKVYSAYSAEAQMSGSAQMSRA